MVLPSAAPATEPYWVLNAEKPGVGDADHGDELCRSDRSAHGDWDCARTSERCLRRLPSKRCCFTPATTAATTGPKSAGAAFRQMSMLLRLRTDQHAAHIVYQGELRPASWVRMQIPIPSEPMPGWWRFRQLFVSPLSRIRRTRLTTRGAAWK